MKWHKTEKNEEGVTVHNQSMVILLFGASFEISNAIKVIERTQYLCWILKREIIQQIMLVE